MKDPGPAAWSTIEVPGVDALAVFVAHLGLGVFFLFLLYSIATGAPWAWGRDLHGTRRKLARYAIIWTAVDTSWDVYLWFRYFRSSADILTVAGAVAVDMLVFGLLWLLAARKK